MAEPLSPEAVERVIAQMLVRADLHASVLQVSAFEHHDDSTVPISFGVSLGDFLGIKAVDAQALAVQREGDVLDCVLIARPDNWDFSTAYPDFPRRALPCFYDDMAIVLSSREMAASPAWCSQLQPIWQDLFAGTVQEGLSYIGALALDQPSNPFALFAVEDGSLDVCGRLTRIDNDDLLEFRCRKRGSARPGSKTLQLETAAIDDLDTVRAALEKAGLSQCIDIDGLLEDLHKLNFIEHIVSASSEDLVLQVSTSRASGSPRARLQLTETLTLPIFDGFDVLLWWPVGSEELVLSNANPIPLKTLDAVLPGPPDVGLRHLLKEISIEQIVIGISWHPCELSRLGFTVGFTPPPDATLFGDFGITEGRIRVDILPDPRVTASMKLQISANEHLLLEGTLPDLFFVARLAPGETIGVTDLLKRLKITDGLNLPTFEIRDLSVEVDLRQGRYAFSLDVATDIGIQLGDGAKLDLKDVLLSLEHARPDGTSVTLEGLWSIELPSPAGTPPLELRVHLDHQGDSAWLASIESTSGELPLGHLLGELGQRLAGGKWEPPPALEAFQVSSVSVVLCTGFGSTDIRCHFEGLWRFGKGPQMSLAVTLSVQNGEPQFEGLLEVGDQHFEVDFRKLQDASVLTAHYTSTAGEVSLADVLRLIVQDPATLDTLSHARVDLKEALLAFSHPALAQTPGAELAATGNKYLVGIGLGAHFSVGKLPLIGNELPDGFGFGFENMKLVIANETFTADDVKRLQSEHTPSMLLSPDGCPKGFHFSADMTFGGTRQTLAASPGNASSTPAASEQPAGNLPAPAPANGAVIAKPAAGNEPTWIDVHRAFGPLHIERIGFQLGDGQVTLGLDSALSLAGLTIALDGLSIHTPLTPFQPTFGLRGLSVDYRNPVVEIGGAFVERGVNRYGGAAVIRVKQLALSALGLYDEVDGHTSMCIYAVLDYPIGGPPFFFVTGLAAAFGYSRKLNPPGIGEIAQFPLVRFARRDSSEATNLSQDLEDLSRAIPPSIGDCFLGLGVKFTSFEIASSFALLTCSFGHQLEFYLLGVSNIVAPPGVAKPAARLEIALKGALLPDAGFFGIQAELTSNSYVLAEACHLSGGFACFSWFGGEHRGDFVLSVGGYHPQYDLKSRAHYPAVPRLALNWKVDDSLTVKGQSYFALTPDALMVGGALDANWVSDHVRAWFKFSADMLLQWKPYHYSAEVHVSIGVDVTFELFGTRHLSLEASADLSVWGPEFSGKAVISLSVISVQVAFGPTAAGSRPVVHWLEFRQSFLPKDVINISVASGLGHEGSGKRKTPASLGTLDAYGFAITIDSAMPLHDAHRTHSKPAVNTSFTPVTDLFKNTLPFYLRPLESSDASDQCHSSLRIHVSRLDAAGNESPVDQESELHFEPITKRVPAALWGRTDDADASTRITREVFTGLTMTTKRPAACKRIEDVSIPPDEVCCEVLWLPPQNGPELSLEQAAALRFGTAVGGVA